jgi:antitoxin HicB
MSSREYEAVLIPEEEGGYSVTVPALPGCTSQGETREEALAMIREAIELYLESLEAHGDAIPGPIEIEPRHCLGVTPRLPAVTRAKPCALWSAAGSSIELEEACGSQLIGSFPRIEYLGPTG